MIISQQSALLIIRCSITEQKTEIDRHFIKEKLDSELICTRYVPTGHQLADVLTKGLCSNVFHKNINKLGMEDLYSPA